MFEHLDIIIKSLTLDEAMIENATLLRGANNAARTLRWSFW